MSAALTLEIETVRPDQVIADVLAVFFFSCDRPLRGPAGRADWRLCGLLSELLLREELIGDQGEAALIPTGGRLRSPLLLAIGLGSRSDFGEETLREVARSAAARLLGLGAGVAGMALPGDAASRLGSSRAAAVVLEGIAAALRERSSALRLRLVVMPEEAGRVRSGLQETASRLSSSELAVHLERSPEVFPHRALAPSPGNGSPAGNPTSRAGFRR